MVIRPKEIQEFIHFIKVETDRLKNSDQRKEMLLETEALV
jgi:hypothetical protein